MKIVKCHKCTMSFRVETPPGVVYVKGKEQLRCERSRCPECKKPFWHGAGWNHSNKVRTGILPEWLPEWQA